MKKLSWLVGVVALLGSGAYLFVYIYRWEWHRALLVGVLFLATLVGLCTGLVVRRLNAVGDTVRATAAAPRPPGALDRLRAAPVESKPFPWLRPADPDRTHIFIPVLLGGGFVVSGIAWLIERVAGSSAREGVEQEVATELEEIAFPATSLVPTEAELLAGDEEFGDDPALRVLLGPAATGTSP
ncbi:hypothetical protein SAMN04515665_1253 [Blastococcus sp. DSM 46786]|uniref:hypothetical protein n=1 Tax=Blastococcus sp. DSM 46786 TaxID=1798227 RepID=UPI0008D2610D|nr:hypothetical protein [Blastococcus sp. DSM 46786]SEL97964.1 hypothetical protein SAMN04515665_1253 [Blastococcus sp. DSM 46786]